ncbi:hypothetical protein HanIR_Chr16g0825011 [Helianthus annuus]|nr:hypothetical protein HanIR_Chr16g0825011 [Helianthus annuus]
MNNWDLIELFFVGWGGFLKGEEVGLCSALSWCVCVDGIGIYGSAHEGVFNHLERSMGFWEQV